MAPPRTLGEHLIDALGRRGVRHLFGVPGDFILGLFRTGADRGMTMVNSTREEAAVYAADGYARERGLGAAAVTFGVGALAGAAAMGGANAERVPVVMIAGAPGLGERDGRRLHHTPGDDIDAPRRALAQVVGETLVLDDLGTALERLDAALDRCVHDHRPLYVELPRDLVDERPAARPRRRARPPPQAGPERIDAGVADVRERLAAARRPVVWTGAGILRRDRGGEAIALAERLGAPVVESVMGKGAVDETHPLVAGVYSGASSDAAVRRMVERADLVLELGVDINDINTGAFTLGVREERRVLADHTGLRVGYRDYPGVTLDDLLDGLRRRPPRRGTAPKTVPSAFVPRRSRGGRRVTCDLLAERLEGFLRPSDILVSDVGVAAHLLMDVRLARARQLHIARLYVGMGFAVPAAAGARLARGRGRPVVLVGDGSFQMTGMDLSTAVSHGLAPIVLVLDNHGYGAERAIVDGPFNDVARWDYVVAAEAVGAEGRRVATPQELDDALAEARRGSRRAWLLWIDLDPHDAPRALRALGKGLEQLMHATH